MSSGQLVNLMRVKDEATFLLENVFILYQLTNQLVILCADSWFRYRIMITSWFDGCKHADFSFLFANTIKK